MKRKKSYQNNNINSCPRNANKTDDKIIYLAHDFFDSISFLWDMNCNMDWCQIWHLWLKFSWSCIYVIICHSDFFIRNSIHSSIIIDKNKTFTSSTIPWLFFSVKKWMKTFNVVKCQCFIDMWNGKIGMKFIDWPKCMNPTKNSVYYVHFAILTIV